jgi:hypothetical protein
MVAIAMEGFSLTHPLSCQLNYKNTEKTKREQSFSGCLLHHFKEVPIMQGPV